MDAGASGNGNAVNQTNVSPQEQLSDEVYYYDREEHCLSMATGRGSNAGVKGTAAAGREITACSSQKNWKGR